MKNITSMPSEFYALQQKLVAELLSIGRDGLQSNRTTSLSGMSELMGVPKGTVFALISSLEKQKAISVSHARIVINENQNKQRVSNKPV